MNISEPFIKRPVATTLLALGLLLVGIICYFRLPIASLPTVERPTIAVWASLPGASPDIVATSINVPLSRELGVIPGLVEMSSLNTQGGVQITLQFELSVNIDAAANAVQSAINTASPNLPSGMPQPPIYYKANPGGAPVIALALTSQVVDSSDVYAYADTIVAQRLSQVKGVARVVISGAERPAVRIQVDPDTLAGMSLSLEHVRAAVASASLNLPKGSISVEDRVYTIGTNDQLFHADEYRQIVVGWSNGAPVLLRDVARVEDSVLNTKLAGWFNNERAVLLFVYREADANVVETVDEILSLVPQLSRWIPPAIKVNVAYDRTLLIRASIADIQMTIAVASILIVLVISLFLKRLWTTAISSVVVPVTLAGTLAAIYALGYSLNNLSLMALTIAVGFVVDDTVIVIENTTRLIEEGSSPIEAAIKGSRQIGFTIVSITAALIAALIPVIFMPDIVGRYFREFGFTLMIAIILSAVLSLTLTPMLCARQPGRSTGRTAHGHGFVEGYLRSLDWTIRHQFLVITTIAGILAGTAWFYVALPKGYMPTQDTGILFVRTYSNPSISFAAMERLQRQVSTTIQSDPAVSDLVSYIGAGIGGVMSWGYMMVNLRPPEQRHESVQEVSERLRQKLAPLKDVATYFIPIQDLNVGTQNNALRFQYVVSSTDPALVARWSETMRRRLIALPEIRDLITNSETTGLEAGLVIDRPRAARRGVTPVGIDNTLYDAFGQRWINLIYLPLNFSEVILEVDPARQTDPSQLDRLFVPGLNGVQVALSSVTRPRRVHGSMWLNYDDRFPATTISFDTKPGVSIGDAISAIRKAEVEANIPDDVKTHFRGEAGEAAQSQNTTVLLFIAALLAIYIVLGMLYESFVHPVIVLSVLPSATFGAFLALSLTGLELNLMSSIACILLVGIVMKNAIMMIDFAITAERKDGLSPIQAIREAASARFRPIVMTSIVALLSACPLALNTGPGHELRQPVGIALVGGLLLSQVLTLYTTPAMYLLLGRFASKSARAGLG
ncbi:efflux RND transporter permease subunit [Bradyrhizobium ontarionense]|uniref:Efflux RND transporter permease subunit n=1 Tax=Bradyrhizobium ontarionense TaxID=2898149 RepID=A0ABY3R7J9_9BRAD|nr:efflux RND transporter permease subunit [Bradyrhizobium sp. A19]UFZ03294.1 efflux RND transporter permease subunit [Bradyrhizobium sp. A19]